ncbi:unnamed protein product [Caenorhabditis angaria]|uniref:Uncharacterized protein n=1 Tax=Caenorhabditis angaria TaxID=860376 RepID=A0A9P1IK48_9PELO|nr:unnamed protein product [Caenorhabditis angaria]
MSEKRERSVKRIEELESRLTNSRKEIEQIREENHKLVEDSKTHEFEIEEINVKAEIIQKEKEEALEKAEHLEKLLEAEEKARKFVESQKLELENQQKLGSEKVSAILENEKTYLENLAKMSQEIMEIKKENEYLTAAQENLIENEMQLKRQISDLTADLKNTENRLEIAENKLKSEERSRTFREKEVVEKNVIIAKLQENREESDELLSELRKSKEEIDFLRKELENEKELRRNQPITDPKLLENLETEKKHLEEEFRILENSKKIETDFLKDELEKRQKSMEEMMRNAENNMKYYQELRVVNEKLMEEFEEYKKNAEHQFFHEVGEHQQMIEHLQKRLVELETYPGQNLSIQKSHQETQTIAQSQTETQIETSPRNSEINLEKPGSDKGSQVSLVSEVSFRSAISPSKTKIEKMTGKLRELIMRDSNSSSKEVFREIVEMLENFGNELNSPVAGASRFYENLSRKLREIENHWKFEYEEELDKMRRQILSAEEKLAEEIGTHSNVLRENRQLEAEIQEIAKNLEMKTKEAEQNYALALGFKEEFDFQFEENKKKAVEIEEMGLELEKWEEEEKGLRERLEKAQADLQRRLRQDLQHEDVHDNEIVELQNALRKMTNESKSLKSERDNLARKNKFNKESFEKLKEAYHTVERKANQFRKSNQERQKTLDYVMKKVKKLEIEMENSEGKRKIGELYGDLQNKTSQIHDDDDFSTKSDPVFEQIHRLHQQQPTTSRRILSNLNQD